MKVSITIDDIRLKSNIKINQTLIFTKKTFFYSLLGFTQSHQGPLNDIEGFYQILAGSYEGDRPINITGIDKVHLKCNVVDGSIVNGKRESILFSFGLSSPPHHKIYKKPRVKLFFKKINLFYHTSRFILKMMITNLLIFTGKRYHLLVI